MDAQIWDMTLTRQDMKTAKESAIAVVIARRAKKLKPNCKYGKQ